MSVITIKELKELFESSSAECAIYNTKDYEVFWVGQINEIPEENDNYFIDLYDATWETKQKYGNEVLFEICLIL